MDEIPHAMNRYDLRQSICPNARRSAKWAIVELKEGDWAIVEVGNIYPTEQAAEKKWRSLKKDGKL